MNEQLTRPNLLGMEIWNVGHEARKVFELLRAAISRGEYQGGCRMSEVDDIAGTYGVSRTPVRAALSELAAEGLLDYTPNAGYIVRSYSPEDMIGIFRDAGCAGKGLPRARLLKRA